MSANLVILALDGVSQTLLWQYREAMPALWDLYNRSAMFRRFYTASTSAFQSFCDLMHGDACELDHNFSYPTASGCLAGQATNLFALLRDHGYAILGLQHGNPCPPYAAGGYFGAWPEGGPFRWHGGYENFYTEAGAFLQQAKTDGKPFALYLSDRAARPGDVSPEKSAASLYHERLERGYALLDQTVKQIMDRLAALDLLRTTIVVAYGPYGMDPWKHGIHLGRTHAIDPYADVCWTPMCIFRNGADVGTTDMLASVIDLKPTIMHMMFPGEPQPDIVNPLAGVDLLRFQRQTALTQSMFALEREGEGPARGLAKAYAATDGDQRLIVSSEKGLHGEGGMELFFDPRDPGNTRNFLDFFELNKDGTMTSFGRSDIIHPHFTQSFKPQLVMSIVDSYNKMRSQLRDFIRIKEQLALQLSGPKGGENFFPEDMFNRKRKRR